MKSNSFLKNIIYWFWKSASRRFPVKKAKLENLTQRYLSKLERRLLNTYKLDDPSLCPNANQQQYTKNLRFLMRQRYHERAIDLEPWRELIDDCLKQAGYLKHMFIDMLADYDEPRELCYWISKLEINPKTLSLYVNIISLSNKRSLS